MTRVWAEACGLAMEDRQRQGPMRGSLRCGGKGGAFGRDDEGLGGECSSFGRDDGGWERARLSVEMGGVGGAGVLPWVEMWGVGAGACGLAMEDGQRQGPMRGSLRCGGKGAAFGRDDEGGGGASAPA